MTSRHLRYLSLFTVILLSTLYTPSIQATPAPGSTVVLSPDRIIGTNLFQTPDSFDVPLSVIEVGENLFVPRYLDNMVKVYDKQGNYLRDAFSGVDIQGPSKMINNGTHIFVLGTLESEMHIFDLEENLVDTWGEQGTATGQILQSANFLLNESQVMILDTFGSVISTFTDDGQYLGNFTLDPNKEYNGFTLFEDHIIATDQENNQIDVFSPTGQFLTSYPISLNLFDPRGLAVYDGFVIIANSSSVVIVDRDGHIEFSVDLSNHELSGLTEISIIDNQLYVTDRISNKIVILDINVDEVSAESDGDAIRVSWSGSQQVMSYNIYRGTSSGHYSKIANVDSDVNYFVDEVVNHNQTYYYVVTAVTENGETQYSPEVVASLTNDSRFSYISSIIAATDNSLGNASTDDSFLDLAPVGMIIGFLTIPLILRYRTRR